MNTLSKQFTLGTFYNEDPEVYTKLRKQWSKMVNSDYNVTLTMAHHILYLVLIGKNWKKAVTLPTNKNKVANHYRPHIELVKEQWDGYFAKRNVISAFGGVVTEEMYDKARKVTDFDMTKDAYKDLENVDE
jgi:hypothetical protein